ncbi:MAG: electron transporter RnfE [Candidatus Moranbacteria bacterium CG08_land_8_20_14_0_20_34_16]|nr:MAG: electron transporter RnfE [Candidatus Moranbacteria bacterium CG08_land_8_20_14_0_20_34_16]
MMWNFSNNPMGWFGFGWIFMFIFWGFIIWGLVTLIGWLIKQKEDKDNSAMDILKKKYANGEINKKEFEEKKKDLI